MVDTVFVIPHRGRRKLLDKTLESVALLQGHTGTVEVIVVTKEPSLQLAPLMHGPDAQSIGVHVIHAQPDITISAQRNLGVQASESSHIAFIDADIELYPSWLATMQGLLNESDDRVLVSAAQICTADATPLERLRTSQSNVNVNTNLEHMPGRNLYLKRRAFERVGGFPEHLSTCEDYFFSSQLAQHGSLYNSTESGYVHLGEDKYLWPMFVKEIWRGASNIQSLKGRRLPLSELPSILVPVWVLVCITFVGVSFANGSFTGCLLGFGAFAVPSLLFTYRLKRKTDASASIAYIVAFYCVYFLARALGLAVGVLKRSVSDRPRRSQSQSL